MTVKRTTIALSAMALAALAAPLLAAQDSDAGAPTSVADDVTPAADAPDAAAAAADAAALAADQAAGQAVFGQRCIGCHGAIGSTTPSMAPKLAGVVGRAAGTGVGRYSEALKTSGITWTAETLDAYIAGPMAMVPGTRMAPSLTDADQRQAVIAYLSMPPEASIASQ
jgi:cytochrome c